MKSFEKSVLLEKWIDFENKIKEFEEITKKLANKVKETNEKFNLDLEGMMKGFKKLEEGIENINI